MENPFNLTNAEAAKAANALNNTGYLHQLTRTFARDTLGRDWYTKHTGKAPSIEEFERLTLGEIGLPIVLNEDAKRAVFQVAANRRLTDNAAVIPEDFAAFALVALFQGAGEKRLIRWGDIWDEIFSQ